MLQDVLGYQRGHYDVSFVPEGSSLISAATASGALPGDTTREGVPILSWFLIVHGVTRVCEQMDITLSCLSLSPRVSQHA
jgi:hypothetical protein